MIKFFILSILIIQFISCKRNKVNAKFNTNLDLKLNVVVQDKNTQPNSKGLEMSHYGEHDIDCGVGLLSAFKLEKNSATSYHYSFKCMSPNPAKCNSECMKNIEEFDKHSCKTLTSTKVPLKPTDPKSTEAMGGLFVQCPDNFVLKQWRPKVTKDQSPQIYYEYTCAPAKTNACGKKSTSELSYGSADHTIISLDRFDVSVPDPKTQAMTGFTFTVVAKGAKESWKMKYDIKYCSITG